MSKIIIFYCYAFKDEELRNELEKHLAAMKRSGFITSRFDRKILPGIDWRNETDTQLNTADIILLLISCDFISSEYCYGKEMEQALARHRAGKARVIPIVLRPVDWEGTPIGKLQMLPRGGKPITSWPDRDEAFKHVAEGIREVVMTLLAHKPKEQWVVERNIIDDVMSVPVSISSVKRCRMFLDNKTMQQWMNEGNAYYNACLYQNALLAFKKALHLDHENDVAYFSEANSLRKLGRNDEALLSYKQAIYLNPNLYAYYHNMALSLWYLGDHNGSLNAFNQAINLNPYDAVSYNSKAALLLELERYDDLLVVYNQLISLYPDNATTYQNKANILLHFQRYNELVPVYDQLIRLEPINPINYLNKAKALCHIPPYYKSVTPFFLWWRALIKVELILLKQRFSE